MIMQVSLRGGCGGECRRGCSEWEGKSQLPRVDWVLVPGLECRRPGSNQHGGCPPTVFETVASAYSATSAGAEEGIRTLDLLLGKEAF
jgi:hypothetical protein